MLLIPEALRSQIVTAHIARSVARQRYQGVAPLNCQDTDIKFETIRWELVTNGLQTILVRQMMGAAVCIDESGFAERTVGLLESPK